MEKLGKMVTCDRCGQKIFLKKTGTGEEWVHFEVVPNWEFWHDIKATLCPICSAEYERIIRGFMEYSEKEEDSQ